MDGASRFANTQIVAARFSLWLDAFDRLLLVSLYDHFSECLGGMLQINTTWLWLIKEFMPGRSTSYR